MNTSIFSKGSTARSVRAYFQLGVATLGTAVILWGLYGFTTILSMPRSESGFAEGLAILFYGVYVLGGFVVLSAGLLIPQRDDSGIQFSTRQRKLLAYGVVAPIVSVLAVPIGSTLLPPLTEPVTSVLVVVLGVLVLSGPVATLMALGSTFRYRSRTMTCTQRSLLGFVLLTFFISWSAWGILAILGTEPGINVGGVLWLLGGLGPPVAAVVVTQVTDGTQSTRQLLGRLFRWRVGWRWYGVAILLPGLVVICTIFIDAQVRGLTTPLPSPEFLLLFVGLVVVSALIGGGLEEIGWRGFALPRLQASFGAFTASLAIGVVWMVWHAPLFVVPGAVQVDLPVLPFVVQGIALAVVFTWLYNSTRGSILLAVLFHGSFNAWLSTVWLLRDSTDPLTLWMMALLVCVIAIGVVVLYGTEHLSRNERQTS